MSKGRYYVVERDDLGRLGASEGTESREEAEKMYQESGSFLGEDVVVLFAVEVPVVLGSVPVLEQ